MAEQFPSIKPSSRSFKLGSFPVKTYRSLSGATIKRAFGNRATSYELKLEFENITDSVASTLLAHYNATSGGFERFTLPVNVFAGMADDLRNQIQAPANIEWEYAGPPEVDSVYPGRSSVSINLLGELTY